MVLILNGRYYIWGLESRIILKVSIEDDQLR